MKQAELERELVHYVEVNSENKEIISIPRGVYLSRAHQRKGRRKHAHSCIEMTYILSGSATHIIYMEDGSVRKETIKMGDYYIIDYNASHIIHDVSKDFLLVNLLFQPSFVDTSLDKYEPFDNLLKSVARDIHFSDLQETVANRVYHDDNSRVRTLFDNAWDLYIAKTPGYRDILRCCISEILIRSVAQLLCTDVHKKHAVVSIRDYVNDHYMEDISLNQICKERCLNMSYISRKFKEVIGISFETYLQNIRIQNACTLLIETEDSVEAIIEKVGYKDGDSFRRNFKRILNTTPLKYRNLFR